jgi:hypothetical protein
MNWIEALFGLSPDNGDGSFETTIVLSLTALVMVLLMWRPFVRHRHCRQRSLH